MTVDLDKLEALEKTATPGPWRACGADRGGCACHSIHGDIDAEYGGVIVAQTIGEKDHAPWEEVITDEGVVRANTAFIAEARNAFPELVREVRELRGIAEAARAYYRMGDALAAYDAGEPK